LSRASAVSNTSQMPQQARPDSRRHGSGERGRKKDRKSPVDWVNYFGGKPPAEIITIHDDDSPAPPAQIQKLPGPTSGGASSHHVGKKRRTDAVAAEANYSTTNTPYSQSNGASTESLQATTAPTSLGSAASSGSKLDGAQTGQKRKRTTRGSELDRKKQESEQQKKGPRGYLAEYGEYIPPQKQARKQKEVHVPSIHEVCDSTPGRVDSETDRPCSATSRLTRSMTKTVTILSRRTASSASDIICSNFLVRALSEKWSRLSMPEHERRLLSRSYAQCRRYRSHIPATHLPSLTVCAVPRC